MRSSSKSRSFLLLFSLLIATFFCSFSARAQSTADTVDDDADLPHSLSVVVLFAQDGTAQVSFVAPAGPDGKPAPEIQSVVESALNCKVASNAPFKSSAFVLWGTCRPASIRTATLREFQISTPPLRKFAQDHQIESFDLSVRMPDVEVTETTPPVVTRSTISVGKFSARLQRLTELNRVYFWKTDGVIPAIVTVRFGLSPRSAERAAAIALAVFLLPAILILWMGRKALASEARDKAVVWFTYMRYLQWTLNFGLLGWWIAADSVHMVDLLKFLSAGTALAPFWKYAVTPIIVKWLPPMFMWMICFVLSHPVQEKLRGLTWTRRELALQAFYSCCVSLVPIAMVLTGITSIATSSIRVALLWFAGALATRVAAARARASFLGMLPQALTTGDLRDRAFGMAKQLGVKLQQIYIIPSGKGQMANAFARKGNIISFTDFLLQRMNRREVNFVLGHELSHLKLGHPGKLALASVISYFVAISAVGIADPFFHFSVVTRYALIVALVTLAPYFCSRRFEYAADAGAVDLTSDPQAAISALFKLAQLNMLPIHWSKWSEKWLTHPSSLRRAQAIARKAGLPPENVSAIAQAATTPEDSFYVLPATVAVGGKVHSTHAKSSGTLRTLLLLLATIILTPAVFALLAAHAGPMASTRIAVYLIGLAATFGMYYLFANYVPPMGLRELAASLKSRFEKEGISTESWDGVFVGFSPAAAPRSYELNTNWDLGCLFIRSDRLCYWGEETKFSLRRDQISAIKLAPGMPGVLPPWRIYFAWKDAERGTSGVFNIGCINGASTLGLRKQSSKLAERLSLWWKSSAPEKPSPAPLAALTSPEIGAVTGALPGKAFRSGKLFKELLNVAFLAVIGAVLCSLPFHLVAFLFSAMNLTPRGLVGLPSPGAGWYVVAVAVAVRFFTLLPVLRYKDDAIVTLAPSSLLARAVNSPGTGEANPRSSDKAAALVR